MRARLDRQTFQISELDPAQVDTIPAAAEPPALDPVYFDETGTLLWICDAEGAPTPSIAEYETALADFALALDGYRAALQSRGAAILAAAEAPPSDGSTAEAPEQTPAPEQAEAPDQTPADPPADAAPPVDQADADQVEPLRDADNPNLFRRVISLPSAQLQQMPDAAAASSDLPTFSVLYVFEEASTDGQDWLKVSPSLRESAQGWVIKEQTLDWSSMLVMKFAPKGKRSDVLFFEDDTDLTDIVNSPVFAAEAQEIYEAVEHERRRLRDDSSADPQWDRRLVAIEPAAAVTFENQPYLLPILDWREELFDGIIETTLLQVAAVPANASQLQKGDRANRGVDLNDAALADDVFRVGVVFVIDTTVSMAPFIERTYETVQAFYDTFQQMETSSFVSFGLVGFRDEFEGRPELEYTTRVFQPLDIDAPPQQVLSNMRQMREATAPTVEFKEDVFAGVIDALEFNDWTPFDARLIVLITDASARTGNDGRAKYIGNTAASVAELARNKNTAILPLHLLTPANQNNQDAATAETQFRALAETGDLSNNKYFALDATDGAGFSQELGQMTRGIARAILDINAGEVPGQAQRDTDVELEEVPQETITTAVATEIFRAQLESLAVAANGAAPNFLAGWTADKDLLDPNVDALEVSVFLTRNQLSSLDKQLAAILDAFRSGGDDPTAFFENLQTLAAQTATDPDVVRSDDSAAMREILPTFLQNLPYKSDVLQLDRAFWNSISVANRSEFIEQLTAKRKIYESIFNTTELWQDFGSNDPLLQVTPVRLSTLP